MLGRDLLTLLGPAGIGLGHGDGDIRELAVVERLLEDQAPEGVILAAAFHDVPRCEKEPETAFAVNAVGALNVARACAAREIRFQFVSTDYVFSGEAGRPYTEADLPAPLNLYGASKAAGELAVMAVHPKAQVVRTCGLFGVNPCRAKRGHHIIEFILGRLERGEPLKMVADEHAAPTWTFNLAEQLIEILERGGAGLYHAVNPPGCSWFDVALEVQKQTGLTGPIEPVSAAAFPSAVPKPRFSVLKNARLERENLSVMKAFPEALAGFLRQRGTVGNR